MAVAYNSNSGTSGYIADYFNGGIVLLSFSFTNTSGNAVCIMATALEDTLYGGNFTAIDYGGVAATQDWNQYIFGSVTSYEFYCGHVLNAGTGAKTINIIPEVPCYDIKALVVSVSGASTTGITSFNKNYGSGFNTTLSTAVTSQVGDLVIGMAACETFASKKPTTLNGTAITTAGEVWGSYYSGAASVTVTQTNTGLTGDDAVFVAGWSFPVPSAPAPANKNQIIGPQVGVWTSSYLR